MYTKTAISYMKNPTTHMHPQKILSKPVSPHTASTVLMTCIPNINHRVNLKWDFEQLDLSTLRITNVAIARPIVIIVEIKFTTHRDFLLFSLNSSCLSLILSY